MSLSAKLHESPRRPYYIETPPYRRSSAGIRVMHLLCHALNRAGEEAYVLTSEVNPELDTPSLSADIAQRHRATGREPIVIYPEIVSGNPRKARSVVRYVLNHPGLIGGDRSFAETELIYAYGRRLLPAGVPEDRVLFLPSVDTRLFNNEDNPLDTERKGILIYPGRYTDGPKQHPDIAQQATVITSTWPANRAELAALFRRSELLYCFESTAVALEAVLCGCPAVILPSPLFKGDALNEYELGNDGLAFSKDPDEIERARQSVATMQARYKALEQAFWPTLERFIETTQAMPCHEVSADAEVAVQPEYTQWRAQHGLNESLAQCLAERMMLAWTHRPSFHLLVEQADVAESDIQALLRSLDEQFYPEWILTVIGAQEAPQPLRQHPKLQWLTLRDPADSHRVLQAMAAASPAQWVGLLRADSRLEPHTLQRLADAINEHPDWQFIYVDDDAVQKGQYHSPRFKPKFNLDLLRSQNYVGTDAWIKKSGLEACGGLSSRALAKTYDLVLQLHDRLGSGVIGHLSGVLIHYPSPPVDRAAASMQERAALQDHLQRLGLPGEVSAGLGPNTHQIRYQSASQARVSVLITVQNSGCYLLPLLQSWQQVTQYPDTEFILADLGCDDPDEQALLQRWLDDPTWAGRIKRVDARHLSPIDALNLAARHACGAYLLCLDVQSHFIQGDWLSRLVHIAERPDVCAVAPRRVNPADSRVLETAWIGGLEGGIGPACRNLELHEAGPESRALCEQNVLAAAGAALLIKRSALGAQALLSPQDTLQNAFIELGLRLSAQGLKLVWTPHSVVLQPPEEPGRNPPDVNRLPAQWLPQLLNDSNYNIHLSLRQPFRVEGARTVSWEYRHGQRERWLCLSAQGHASACLNSLRHYLQAQGAAHAAAFENDLPPQEQAPLLLEIARAAPDCLVLHGLHSPSQQALLRDIGHLLPQVRRIGLIDTLSTLPWPNFLCPKEPALLRSMLRRLLASLDTVLVASASDAALIGPAHPDVRVMPPLPAIVNSPSAELPKWLQR